MNLIILYPQDMLDEDRCNLTGGRAEHIRTVLRARAGDTVRVGMLNGLLGTGEVTSIDPTQIFLRCRFDRDAAQSTTTIDLLCAVCRPKTVRKILFVAGMMGVHKLVFVRANKTDKSYLSSSLLTPEGAFATLVEGMSQGGFTQLPKIHTEPLFRPFVEDRFDQIFGTTESQLRLLAAPSAGHTVESATRDCDKNHMVVAIGPEGGWVPFEQTLLEQQQFVPVSLGPWTLRVESAVVAILAQIALARARA